MASCAEAVKRSALIIGMAGVSIVAVGALQILLLLFSARAVVCYTSVMASIMVPFAVSHVLREKVAQPHFAYVTYIAAICGTLAIVRLYAYPEYPGVYTPASWAIFFSSGTIFNPGQPWSAALETGAICLVCVLLVTVIGIYV